MALEEEHKTFAEMKKEAVEREASRAGVQIKRSDIEYDETNIVHVNVDLKPSRFRKAKLEVDCNNVANVCDVVMVVSTTPATIKEIRNWSYANKLWPTQVYETRDILGAKKDVLLSKYEIAVEKREVPKSELFDTIRRMLSSFQEAFEKRREKPIERRPEQKSLF
ncbi:MAG: hypothetical protein ACP5KW_12260 [Thermoproteota archaeon]